MENNPKVSIVVTVYNCEPYLEKCINSLIKQRYSNIEIILVDDGSRDNSFKVCQDFAKQDNRIVVFHKENGGDSSAKNLGLSNITGEYFAFVDSDDSVSENYISDMIFEVGPETDLVVMGYTVVYTGENRYIDVLPQKAINVAEEDRYRAILAMGTNGILNVDVGKLYSTRIYRKWLLEFDTNFTTGEDLIFNCKYYPRAKRIVILPKSNYYYYKRDTVTLVNQYRNNAFEISCRCIESVGDMCEQILVPRKIAQDICNTYCLDYMSACIHNLFREQCPLTLREKQEKVKEIFDYCQKFGLNNAIFDSTNRIQRIFLYFSHHNNSLTATICYMILFLARNRMQSIWKFVRKWMLK